MSKEAGAVFPELKLLAVVDDESREALSHAINLMRAELYHDEMSNPFPHAIEDNQRRIELWRKHIGALETLRDAL